MLLILKDEILFQTLNFFTIFAFLGFPEVEKLILICKLHLDVYNRLS